MPLLDRGTLKSILLKQAGVKNNWLAKGSGMTIAMTEQVESFKIARGVNVDLYKIIFHHAVATGKQHMAKKVGERVQETALIALTAGIGNNIGGVSIGDVGVAATDIGAGGTVEVNSTGGLAGNHHEAVYRSLKKTDRWEAAKMLPSKYACLVVKILSQDKLFNFDFVMYMAKFSSPAELEQYYPLVRAGENNYTPYVYRLHGRANWTLTQNFSVPTWVPSNQTPV